jgi:hypothetical protein
MRGSIRAVVVTQFAVVALVDHPLMFRRHDLLDMAVVPVDPVQERVERRTEVEAAAAAVADFIDAQRIFLKLLRVDRRNKT